MRSRERWIWVATGLLAGFLGAYMYFPTTLPRLMAGNDRHEDYILCTGPVAVNTNAKGDGLWMLDYRSGKLLASVIDRTTGKIANWAEVDLVNEFGIQPKQHVHFLMTTGTVTAGQSALYLAETTTGKFAVYTMGPRPDGRAGIAVRRHDLTQFRQPLAPGL